MNSTVPFVFDPRAVRRNRDRAARHDHKHRFLSDWCLHALKDRLDVVRRRFPMALQLGALVSPEAGRAFETAAGIDCLLRIDCAFGPLRGTGRSVQADIDMLPFADAAFDLVYSPFALHTVNDLPGALAQIRRVLKPDGLFVAAMAGGETLMDLRQCLMEAELLVRGGASARVFPFADKPEMGSLLQRAGFALPVIDSETVSVTYENPFALMRDLRLMGEGNGIASREKNFARRSLFLEAARLYANRHAERDGRVVARFEIIFLLGWSPHESQQKPLRPGQSTVRLADLLDSREQSAGEAVGRS